MDLLKGDFKLEYREYREREREIKSKMKTRLSENDQNEMTIVDKLLKEWKQYCSLRFLTTNQFHYISSIS